MQIITSKDNEIIKNIRKLKDKKYRDIDKKFIIEGIKLIKEAIEEKSPIDTIVVCEECMKEGIVDQKLLYEVAKYNCIYVSEKVFQNISEVNNPQGILAVINKEVKENEIDLTEDIILVLDGIQDPGNLGTIIRTADSVGLKQIIISKDTVDCFNPKVVRSTMGAIFRVKIIEVEDIVKTLTNLKKNKYEILVTSLQTENNIYDIDLKKHVIVIGNEANGVSEEVRKVATVQAKIPMLGKTESLNASVATGVILYEYVRRKINTKNKQ